MADEKEPTPGEDPWAGLESEQVPELSEGFDFSFDESSDADDQAAEPPAIELSAPTAEAEAVSGVVHDGADDADVDEWLEEPEAGVAAPELFVFQSGEDDAPEEGGDLLRPVAEEPSSIDSASEHSEIAAVVRDEANDAKDTPSEGDDFGGDDPFAAAIASELFDGDSPEESAAAAAGIFEPGDEPGDDTDDAAGNAGGMFSFTETAEDDADNGRAENDAEELVESNDFAFMGLSAGVDASEVGVESENEELAEGESAPAEEDDATPVIAGGAVAEPAPAAKKSTKPTRPAPAKKKQPSMVGQMVGMVVGGAMSIPIVLAILWWGVGKDPLKVAPMVPDALSFLLPAKLRSGGQVATTTGGGGAQSLDDVLGGTGSSDPDSPDVAAVEPDTSDESLPVLPEPTPTETDVTAVEPAPAPDAAGQGDDELMALLNEETAPPVEPTPPPATPEPEPLDMAALQDSADKALAALAAVEGVSDPTDPVHKKLLVECYKALATYAQELAMLERVATDTGRPLTAMPAPVTAMHDAVSGRPELFEALARLTRDWLAYSRRSTDGVVAPATFVSARKVGPYWRAEVTVGDRPLVVLTRSEPAATQGEMVIVTGLSVDKDVVWATDIRPAKAADPFGL